MQAGLMAYAGVGTPRNDAAALQWFKRASELGNPDGSYHYGYLRSYGYGITPDPADGAAWYLRAAQAGSASGQLAYAMALLTGSGVARQALAWNAHAAALGHPGAQAELGLLLVQGIQVPKDGPTGLRLVQDAARKGNSYAWFLLGRFYYAGPLPVDYAQSVQAYHTAIALGYSAACMALTPQLLRLATLSAKPDAAQKDHALAQSGDGAAMLRLADRYAVGLGLAASRTQALDWYQKATQRGNTAAEATLGYMLVTAQLGVSDSPKGIAHVRHAAQAGDPGAMYTLGQLLESGVLQEPDAKARARQWYQQAAGADNPMAVQRLRGKP